MKKNKKGGIENRRDKNIRTQGSIKADKDRNLNKEQRVGKNDQKVEDQSNYEYRANDEDMRDDKRKNYSEAGKFSGGAQSQEAGEPGNAKSKRTRKGPSTQ